MYSFNIEIKCVLLKKKKTLFVLFLFKNLFLIQLKWSYLKCVLLYEIAISVCLFDLILYIPVNIFFSYVGMGLPQLSKY